MHRAVSSGWAGGGPGRTQGTIRSHGTTEAVRRCYPTYVIAVAASGAAPRNRSPEWANGAFSAQGWGDRGPRATAESGWAEAATHRGRLVGGAVAITPRVAAMGVDVVVCRP